MKTGWLVCQAQVLSSLNIADTRGAKRRGVIGKKELETPILLQSCRWVHTIGVKIDLDIAYLDQNLTVVKVDRLSPMRVALPVMHCAHVLEAQSGAFERWGLTVGHTLEVKGT